VLSIPLNGFVIHVKIGILITTTTYSFNSIVWIPIVIGLTGLFGVIAFKLSIPLYGFS